MTAVIDYGVGNLFSLISSLRTLGQEVCVTADEKQLCAAQRMILPGVGAFGDAMEKLCATGLVPALKREAAAGKPLFGICLGMQLLFERSSEYGSHEGLGLLAGEIGPLEDVLRAAGFSYKVPHMGWNALRPVRPEHPLLSGVNAGDAMYFVHSYYAKGYGESLVATAEYGVEVPAVVARGNVCGCQFHPEKSGRAGLAVLRAFAEL